MVYRPYMYMLILELTIHVPLRAMRWKIIFFSPLKKRFGIRFRNAFPRMP